MSGGGSIQVQKFSEKCSPKTSRCGGSKEGAREGSRCPRSPPPFSPQTRKRSSEEPKTAQEAARTADNSSKPPFPAGKLQRIGGRSRADTPQLRPRGAGEDGTQLPSPFNHSSLSRSRARGATDGGAAFRAARERHRVPAAETFALQGLLTRP